MRPADDGSSILLFLEQQHIFCDETGNKIGLTRREGEVLRWMAEGKSYDVIGTILGVSSRTVGNHVQSIYKKFHVSTRTDALHHVYEALGKPQS